MSYCREPIYAYRTGGGYCIHTGQEHLFVTTAQEFRDHLVRLNAPDYAIARINREIEEEESSDDNGE